MDSYNMCPNYSSYLDFSCKLHSSFSRSCRTYNWSSRNQYCRNFSLLCFDQCWICSKNKLIKLGMAVLMLGMMLGWKQIFDGMDRESFFKWVIIVHILGWVFQFIGHGVFESTSINIKRESQHFWTTSVKF